jgi:hypothetical protein
LEYLMRWRMLMRRMQGKLVPRSANTVSGPANLDEEAD